MNKEFEILWKGDIPITALKWKFDRTAQLAFTQELEEEMADFWVQAVKHNPKMYNGTLLCVHKINYQPEKIDIIIYILFHYLILSWTMFLGKGEKLSF